MRNMTTMLSMFAVAAFLGCGVSTEEQADDSAQASTTEAASPEPLQVAVPPELQIGPRAVSCASEGDSCLAAGTCRAEGGRFVSGNCASGLICCSFHAKLRCTEAGNVCIAPGTCRAEGTIVSFPGCGTGLICCQF